MRVSDLLDPDLHYNEADLPVGGQEPTHRLVPPAEGSHGHDAVEFADYLGYKLLPFQAQGLIDDLGYVHVETVDGDIVERWAAPVTEEIIGRRNGKTVRLAVLILFALFILGERKVMYTAHRDDTAADVFTQIVAILKAHPRLWAEVVDSGPRKTNGQRAIELKSGQIVFFRTRSAEAGRGQGYDRLILDEDQHLTEDELAALMPLVSGEPNAQLNYAGSAGGRAAAVQAATCRSYTARERGLCYRGWHAEPDDDLDDLDLIARLNPRLGRGLSYMFVAKEFSSFSRANFGRERCGAATYPRGAGEGWVIPQEAWERARDEHSTIARGAPLFALEATPDLERATIGVAGWRADGGVHIEVTANEPGITWVLDRTVQLTRDHDGAAVVDPKGPLAGLIQPLRDAGVTVHTLDSVDLRDAAAWIYTAARPTPDPTDPEAPLPMPTVRHRGGARLTQALAAAETRRFLDRWTWRRQVAMEVDQGPLTACTWAGYFLVKLARSKPPATPVSEKHTAAPRRRGYRPAPRRGDDLTTTGF